MKSNLPGLSVNLFLHIKKNVLAVFLSTLFLCVHSNALFAQSGSVTCPADIVQNNDPGSCSAGIIFPGADNDDPNVTYTLPSGSPVTSGRAFPVGTTRVIKSLVDQNGTPVSSCSFTVTVLDKEAPVFTNCTPNLSVNNTKDSCGAIVSFTPPGVYERCTSQQKTFDYTGMQVPFVVPAGVTSVDVDVKGAAGGHTYYNNTVYGNPGFGGETFATIAVTPGQVLYINVGGGGQNASSTASGKGGFNGGGDGSAATDENNVVSFAAGGGGGASDIRTAGVTLNNRIIVAGGGGAAGVTQAGGNGGDLQGADGGGGTTVAMGGTQTDGGAGATYDNDYTGYSGNLGTGGNGANETPGGGGGGGLYGGGGGAFGSGAGGSGYAFADAINVYELQGGGSSDGNGSVTLSFNQPATVVQTAGFSSGSLFPVGTTTNTFTATDASGNTSSCTFTVTVADTQAPVITAPANVTVPPDVNSTSATHVILGTPVTSDNCGVASVTNNAPTSYPAGTTTVTYTVTDTHGNSSTASQTVTVTTAAVTDNQAPRITAPSNITVPANANSCSATNVALGTPAASDNSGAVTVTNNAPASFPVGTTTVTYTATDAHGNSSVAKQTVTVTDTQKPVIKAPSNVSVVAASNSCSATNVALGTPTASDNCGVSKVTNNAPATFPVGTTTVTYMATDIHGNSSAATQTVTVTDNQKPVVIAPAAQTFTTTATSYSIPALVATDNCGIASVTYSVSGATVRTGTGTNASGSFKTGTSVITYTVTDIHGNVQTASTTVTVSPTAVLKVTIPDVYAVLPGGQANTIYIGYGPSYVSLLTVVSGGKSPYTYQWKVTGYANVICTSQTLPVFLPAEYVVTVTDSKGAAASFKKQVVMVDVRCGSKNDHVSVCVTTKGTTKKSTICADQASVSSLLKNGGTLGQCTTSCTANTSAIVAESAAKPETAAVAESPVVVVDQIKKFSVYPNPTSGQFTVHVSNFKATKAEILLLSQNGVAVQRKSVELTGANQSIAFNIGNLAAGVYLVKVVTDEGIHTAKVVLHH